MYWKNCNAEERRQNVRKMKAEGLSFLEIGKRLGISRQRAHQLFHGRMR